MGNKPIRYEAYWTVALGAVLSLPAWSAESSTDASTSGGAADDSTLSEVTVTAQRREEKSRDVPITVTTLNSDQLTTA